MATKWTWRALVFVPVQWQSAANVQAGRIDADTGGTTTFLLGRYSPNGQEPATHIGAVLPLTDALLARAETSALVALSGVRFYRWKFDDPSTVVGTNSPSGPGSGWDTTKCISDAGLQPIATPLIPSATLPA